MNGTSITSSSSSNKFLCHLSQPLKVMDFDNYRDNIFKLQPTESEEGLISEDEDNYPVVDRSSDARTAVVNTELPAAVPSVDTCEGHPSCRDSHREYTKLQRLRHKHRRQEKREQKQRRIPYRPLCTHQQRQTSTIDTPSPHNGVTMNEKVLHRCPDKV